jgi:type III restriction enzyme
VSRLINEQQARMLVQNLAYRVLDEGYPENEIFITNENIPFDSYLAQRHVWDYVVTDSQTERSFVEELEQADEVVVYAKLPDRFQIPTPFGGYTPDWAIAFKQGKVRHLYFIAETKGSMDESSLREIEKSKIDSAKKFFNALNEENKDLGDKVVYSVVDNYSTLMNIVK